MSERYHATAKPMPFMRREAPKRHLQSTHPTRALCGASIRWVNVTVKPELATCNRCLEESLTE